MQGQTSLSFPPEIWWLVCQEFAARRDSGGLFLCARLGKGIARLALPELYAIHDQLSNIMIPDFVTETSICFWRSIIVSGLSKTLFPYCCWIKILKLGSIQSLLEDLARDNLELKARFFSPPLEKLQICRGRRRALHVEAIVMKIANLLTKRIRTSAAQEGKWASPTTLECNNLLGPNWPTANLLKWVSSLSRLTSLSLSDGSMLNEDVARAIRAKCPAFREL